MYTMREGSELERKATMENLLLITNAKVVSDGAVRDDCGILVDGGGRISDVFDMQDMDSAKHHAEMHYDAQRRIVSPGLVDTHIHGIGGFGTDVAEPASILGMSKKLIGFGVTGFLPTLYAGRPSKMAEEAECIVEAIGHEDGAVILGVNMEGPFLSPKKAGAQDPESLTLPNAKVFEELCVASKGHLVCMTIAPELEGIEEVASMAAKKGIVLLAGHTNATYDEALYGIELGIHHATHMFNAMSPLNHKQPGVAGAALMDDRMNCEIIADGVHVHKDLVRFTMDKKPNGNVVLITDSLTPTALGKGTFTANGTKVVLGDRGAFVDAFNPELLCGSALTLNKGVRNAVSWGVPIEKAIAMATCNPARIYGFKDFGSIKKGHLGNIAVFDDDFNAVAVFVNGERRA